MIPDPWRAALASMISFAVGALLPLLTVALTPAEARIVVTVVAVAAALALTGYASARLGLSPVGRAIARNVCGGLLAMGITYLIGTLAGARI